MKYGHTDAWRIHDTYQVVRDFETLTISMPFLAFHS